MTKRHWALAIGIVGGVCILVGAVVLWPRGDGEIQVLGSETEELTASGSAELMVDISGAVLHPGVYAFSYGKRIADALEAAGGLTVDADREWIDRKLNKSEKLKDGIKLYIPSREDKMVAVAQESGLVNVNEAGQSELETLSGIGAATAKKIISGRPYSRLEELVEKKIVGQKVFDQIRDQMGL